MAACPARLLLALLIPGSIKLKEGILMRQPYLSFVLNAALTALQVTWEKPIT